jgi:hypothetical protein
MDVSCNEGDCQSSEFTQAITAPFGSNEFSYTHAQPLEMGNYTINYDVTDIFGNPNQYEYNFTVNDRTKPYVMITSPTEDQYYCDPAVTITGYYADLQLHYVEIQKTTAVQEEYENLTECNPPCWHYNRQQFTDSFDLLPGENNILVTAYDIVGQTNQSPQFSTLKLTYDSYGPQIKPGMSGNKYITYTNSYGYQPGCYSGFSGKCIEYGMNNNVTFNTTIGDDITDSVSNVYLEISCLDGQCTGYSRTITESN